MVVMGSKRIGTDVALFTCRLRDFRLSLAQDNEDEEESSNEEHTIVHGRLDDLREAGWVVEQPVESDFVEAKLVDELGHKLALRRGRAQNGLFQGLVTEEETFPTATFSQVNYSKGVRQGFYRIFSSPNNLLVVAGKNEEGRPKGIHWFRREGDSFLIGKVNGKGKLEDEQGVYLYPDLRHGIRGEFVDNKLANGHYGMAINLVFPLANSLPMVNMLVRSEKPKVCYDPSTTLSIGSRGMMSDLYEMDTVKVANSTLGADAGQGLFAMRDLDKGELVCLFNGVRIRKLGRAAKTIKYGDPDWSDFRIVLNKEIDLDVPEESRSISNYCATLGHKACHAFGEGQNATFKEFYHPRFGLIMSVVAIRAISAGSEVFVNYNYDLNSAPPWYLALIT